MKRIAIVVLSGGQDSSTCLAYALHLGYDQVRAITFDYGQRHSVEIDAAKRMIDMLASEGIVVPWEVVRVPNILQGSSPLVDAGAKVEEYADAESLPGGLEKTFVPMRNALFLTIAANRAVVAGLAAWDGVDASPEVDIFTGVSQEDYGGYPDCRDSFIAAMESMMQRACDDQSMPFLDIRTPLLHRDKRETVLFAESLPYGRALNSLSHTCYNGKSPPCGKCHACLLRAKGYKEADVIDPIGSADERGAFNVQGVQTGRIRSSDPGTSALPMHSER